MKRLSRKNNLGQIQGESHKDAQLESTEGPDINTLDILPCADSGEASICQQTKDGINFEAGIMGPHLAEYSVYDERETIEEEGEASQGEEREDGRATRCAAGDDDRSDR